ncbi:hypothetical protein [Endobacterium cereale]|uniref:hypothetical protein n=1 Tax=Endobacterium cereale TaxID=2663029 RepID=UPI002B476DC2|nr:hypothetical protein [Endobacterium cereale]MEB2842938.1 hypothetical protein [Endobacterium cereale]
MSEFFSALRVLSAAKPRNRNAGRSFPSRVGRLAKNFIGGKNQSSQLAFAAPGAAVAISSVTQRRARLNIVLRMLSADHPLIYRDFVGMAGSFKVSHPV